MAARTESESASESVLAFVLEPHPPHTPHHPHTPLHSHTPRPDPDLDPARTDTVAVSLVFEVEPEAETGEVAFEFEVGLARPEALEFAEVELVTVG